MKKTFFIILIAASISSLAFAKTDIDSIEIFNETPKKSYSLISPISADKDSMEQAFKRLKEKAADMGADAIINLQCQAGSKTRVGILKIKMVGESSMCQGLAVKWKS